MLNVINRLNVHEIKHVYVVNGSSLSVDSLGTTHVGWDITPWRVLAEDTSNHAFRQMTCDDQLRISLTTVVAVSHCCLLVSVPGCGALISGCHSSDLL